MIANTPARAAYIRSLDAHNKPIITKRELVADNVAAFGYYEAAIILKKKVCFTLAYWLIFGRAPRKLNTPAPVAANIIDNARWASV